MHIKRLLSGSLAALMVASSFNVPVVNAAAIDEPTEVVEKANDALGDDDFIVDDALEEETEETTEVSEPEETPAVEEETPEEAAPEEATPEVVVEEAGEQEVVGDPEPEPIALDGKITVASPSSKYTGEDITFPQVLVDSANADTGKVSVVWTNVSGTVVEKAKEAGVYTVTVTPVDGNEDFTGSGTATFTVTCNKVTFKSGEGAGDDVDVTDKSSDYALPSNTFTAPTGRIFKCWSVKIGEDPAVEKAVGETIDVTADTTVTAVWAFSKTIKFDPNVEEDVVVRNLMPDQTIIGSGKLNPCTMIVSGKDFKGWSTTKDGTVEYSDNAVFDVEDAEDVVLYAVWGEETTDITVSFYDGNVAITGTDATLAFKKGKAKALTTPAAAKKEGYTLVGWSKEKGAETADYSLGQKATFNKNTVLYAVWKYGATFEDGLTLVIDDEYAYTGSNLKTSIEGKIKVTRDDEDVDSSKITFAWKKYDGTKTDKSQLEALTDTTAWKELTADGVKTTGFYAVTVSVAADYDVKACDKTAIIKVVKPVFNADLITLSGSSTNTDSNYQITDPKSANKGKFVLHYVTTDGTDKGKKALAVQPIVNIAGLTATTDYTVGYDEKTNAKLGTSEVTVTFNVTDETKALGIYEDTANASTTKRSLKKSFEIVACDHKDKVTYSKVETKATATKDGEKTGYCSVCGKLESQAIPKIDASKSTVVGSLREADFEAGAENKNRPTIDGIFDSTGKEITGLTEVTGTPGSDEYSLSYDVNADGKGVITVTLGTLADYEGSFDLAPIEFKDCDHHDFVKTITPGTTKAQGKVEYVCKNCGTVNPDKPIQYIEKLAGVDFYIGATQYALKNEKTTVEFLGKPITIKDITVNSENTISSNEYSSDTYKAEYKDVDEDGKDTGYFTVSYKDKNGKETNKGVGKCTVTITFTDKIPEYAGSSITKTFNIQESDEKAVAPTIKEPKDLYHYGDEIVLESATPGAKVYWKIAESIVDPIGATPTGATTTESILKSVDSKDTINTSEATAYKNAIKLDSSMYSEAGSNVTIKGQSVKTDTIILIAAAQKGNGEAVQAKIPITVVDPRDDYGDVNRNGYKDRELLDATEIPEGIWISDATMATISDHSNRANDTYTGLPKVLPTKFTRGGATIDPTKNYRVFFHNELLTCGTDYTVSYKNNINAWTYEGVGEGIYNAAKAPTITITGKGQYAGSFSQTFEIQPVDINSINITPYENENTTPATLVPDVTLAETAKAQTPKFAAKYNYYLNNTNYTGGSYKTLTLGAKDITADYRDVQAAANTTAKPLYEVKLTGTGNYTGTVSRYVKVVPSGLLLNKATVSFDTSEVNFNGKDQLDNVKATVKLGTIELAQGKDFELACEYQGLPKANKTDYGYKNGYSHNNELYTAGKYIITVKAKAGSNYSGEVSKTVTINKKGELAIKSVDVTLPNEVPALTQLGSSSTYASLFADGTVDVRDGGNILVEDKDYLLLYRNNLKAGKAKVQVVGIGKYSGTKDVAYTIDATKLTEANIKLKGATEFTYDGGYQYQDFDVVVMNDNQPKTLQINKDYVVTWAKDEINAGKKVIKVTGINNYKGTVNVKYEIKKFNISELVGSSSTTVNSIGLKVVEKDAEVPVQYTGSGEQPELFVPSEYGKTNVNYPTWVKQNFTFSYKNGFKAGSTVTVKVTGKKNFTGSVTGTYTVGKADINNTDVTITDVSANKKFVAPTLNVFVKGTTKKLARETRAKWTTTTKDYTVEYLYNATTANHKRYDAVNTKEAMVPGTEYIARINGVGSYENYKDVVFRVVDKSQDISKATIKVNGTYIFRDQPIMLDKDDISVSIGGKAVPSENFEIVGYTNNNKVGTAKVKIHGVVTDDKNKYGGYKEATFKIQKLSMNYILQFKADKISTDNKTLTIGGNMANKTQKDNAVFVLPKNSFTASVGTGKDKVSYVLSYYFDAAGNKYQPGDVYDAATDPSVVATLTAKFEPAKDGATLTFKGGEGATGTAPKDIKTKRGIVSKLPGKGSLKKDNFVFVGWTNNNGLTVLKAGATVCNIENGKNTFTAVWAEAPYKIAYNYNGGNAPAIANPATYTKADANKEIVVNNPTRSGYQFAGWTDGTKDQAPVAKYKVPADKVGKTINLKANWKPNTFTLAFDANGVALATGTTVPTAMANQKVGEAIKLPEALTTADKQIVKFEGWAKDKNSAKPDYKAKATVKDILAENNSQVVLYAVWTPVQYKITWDMNGGKSNKAGAKVYTAKTASSITTEAGFPEAPTRAKRTFGGWKIDGKGTAVTSLASLAADPKDVTLVADWGDKDNTATKKITYNTGDAGIVMAAKEVVVPDTVTLDTLDASKATSKTADKYVFSGWDADSNGTVDYGNGAEIEMNDADVTLTAVWKEKSYAIHYNTNGATFKSGASINRTFKATIGASLPAGSDMDYAGHSFGGWFEKSDLSGTAVTSVPTDAVADVTYYAKWTGHKMTIKYDKGDATFNEGVTKIDDQVYQISPDKDVTNPTALASAEFTKKGYTFKGWTIKDEAVKAETLDTLVAKLTDGTFADNATVPLVPIWEANKYSVVYNYDGGKLSDADAKVQPSEFTVGVTEDIPNKIYTTLQDPEQRGKTFEGWYVVDSSSAAIPTTDAKKITNLYGDSNAIPASGNTLYLRAKWTDKAKLTITFKAGSEAGAATTTQVLYAGETAPLAANTFTKSGNSFKQWQGTGGPFADKAEYTVSNISSDTTLELVAVWDINKTTINYNANGGSGTVSPTEFDASAANTTKVAKHDGMTKTNYTFKEWNTKRNGSGTSYAEESSAAALAPTTYSKEVTLYAIWTENDYALVTFDTNGGSELTGEFAKPIKYYTAKALAKPTSDPTRAGYIFNTWKVGSEAAPATITEADIKAKKSIVVKADWTEVTYKITWTDMSDGQTNPNASRKTWKASDGEVTLANPTTTNTGETFAGWTWKVTGEAGDGTPLAGGKLNTTNINVNSANTTVEITITANWE